MLNGIIWQIEAVKFSYKEPKCLKQHNYRARNESGLTSSTQEIKCSALIHSCKKPSKSFPVQFNMVQHQSRIIEQLQMKWLEILILL